MFISDTCWAQDREGTLYITLAGVNPPVIALAGPQLSSSKISWSLNQQAVRICIKTQVNLSLYQLFVIHYPFAVLVP